MADELDSLLAEIDDVKPSKPSPEVRLYMHVCMTGHRSCRTWDVVEVRGSWSEIFF